MSNAMRFGKRTLAGVAAGALGVGMMATFAANPAQATNTNPVINMTLQYPGVVIVPPDDSSVAGAQANAAIPILVELTDVNGNPVNADGSTESLTASITTPTGATASKTNSFGLNPQADAKGTISYTATSLWKYAGTYDDTGLYGFTIDPVSGSTGAGDISGWSGVTGQSDDSAVPAGTYTVTVRYQNNTTGTTLSKAFSLQVLATSARPSASVQWGSDATMTNFVNQVGAAYEGTAANAYLQLKNSSGWPVIVPDQANAAAGTKILTGTTLTETTGPVATASVSSGFNKGSGATSDVLGQAVGAYTLNPTGGNWLAASSGGYRITYATASPTTSTLPVVFGNVSAGAGSATATATVTTTPNNLPTSGTVQVQAGATSISYSITVDDTVSGTLPWNITSDLPGAVITPSGGVVSFSNNRATITASLNAIAAADTSVLTLTAGSTGKALISSYQVTMTEPVPALTIPGTLVGKIGSAVPVAGTLTDQFGDALSTAGWVISLTKSGSSTVLATTTTIAPDGAFALEIPAASAPTAAADVTYNVSAALGTETATAATTVTYNASGEITSLSAITTPLTVGTSIPALKTPGTGTVGLGSNSTVSTAIVTPASAGTTAPAGATDNGRLTVTTVPATAVTIVAPEGVYLATGNTGNVAWNDGKQTLTVASGVPVTVWTTKAGQSTINVSAGGKTTTASVYGFVPTETARNVALDPVSKKVDKNTFTNVTLKVTDVFGNAVPNVPVGTAVQATGVTLGLSGGGGIGTLAGTTTAAGTYTFAYTAPEAAGTAQISAAGQGYQFATTIIGAPAATATATSTIEVAGSITDKTILIVGERGTVSGKPGILVDGDTNGFERGSKVKPWVRFPGQSSYSEGSARPEVSAAGDFSWQRKTGKKTYVFFTSEDDAVKSNRIIIAAN